MRISDPFIWICAWLGLAGGYSLLVLVEQGFSRLDRCVLTKIEHEDKSILWQFLHLLLRILIAPFVAAYFFLIPFVGNLSHHYFSVYLYAFVLGFLLRLPKFIRWARRSKKSSQQGQICP
jgi:hypothetical protein